MNKIYPDLIGNDVFFTALREACPELGLQNLAILANVFAASENNNQDPQYAGKAEKYAANLAYYLKMHEVNLAREDVWFELAITAFTGHGVDLTVPEIQQVKGGGATSLVIKKIAEQTANTAGPQELTRLLTSIAQISHNLSNILGKDGFAEEVSLGQQSSVTASMRAGIGLIASFFSKLGTLAFGGFLEKNQGIKDVHTARKRPMKQSARNNLLETSRQKVVEGKQELSKQDLQTAVKLLVSAGIIVDSKYVLPEQRRGAVANEPVKESTEFRDRYRLQQAENQNKSSAGGIGA